MDAIEIWHVIPGHEDYEVSDCGIVRSWKKYRGMPVPRTLRVSCSPSGDWGYCLDGRIVWQEELLAIVEDLPTGRAEFRALTSYEYEEIRGLEGIKPAFAVAAEFSIDPSRVRHIWDGLE